MLVIAGGIILGFLGLALIGSLLESGLLLPIITWGLVIIAILVIISLNFSH